MHNPGNTPTVEMSNKCSEQILLKFQRYFKQTNIRRKNSLETQSGQEPILNVMPM